MPLPLYSEFGRVPYSWVTLRELNALAELGFEFYCDGDARNVRIVSDTSEQSHERCGEPMDSLEMIG